MKADLSAVNGPTFDKFLSFVRYTICGIEEDDLRRYYAVTYTVFCSITLSINFYTSFYYATNDFDKVAVILHHNIAIFDIWMITVVFYKKKDKLLFILNSMNKTFEYGEEEVELFVEEMFKKREPMMKLAYNITRYLPLMVFLNLNLFAVMERYFWKTDIYFSPYPVFPTRLLENWAWYALLIIWQQIVMFFTIYVLFALMGILYLIYNHVVGEFAVLNHALSTINKRINSKILLGAKGKLFNETCIECTNQCARHHHEIIKYFKAVNECFNFLYLLVVVSGLFLLVTAGYAAISDNTPLKARFAVVLGVEFLCIYFFCWIGEDMAAKSENVRFTVYDTEWWDLPKSSLVVLRLIMVRTMKPLYLKTLTGQKISLDSYSDCIKGAYSYFNLILRTTDK